MIDPYAARTHEKMKDVLMDPHGSGPNIHYYMIRGGETKKNITVWESGTVSDEYIKAYGHYHILDFKETYWIIEGEGILLLQARRQNQDGTYSNDIVTEFHAIKVHAGDSITIPPFMGHLMINTGKTWLVTSDDSPVNLSGDSASMPEHADYEPVKEMQGFAYYVVQKDGGPALVKNPKYTTVPDAQIISLSEFTK